MHLNELAKHLRTAGDERRLHVLCYLMKQKEICVSDIAHHLHMSIATTSHHLQVMANDDLVVAVRDGKRMCYKLADSQLVMGLKKFICAQAKL